MYYALYSTKYYLSFVSESGNKRVGGERKEKKEELTISSNIKIIKATLTRPVPGSKKVSV